MQANQRALGKWLAHLLACSMVALTACSANAGFGPFKPTFSHRALAPLALPHLSRLAAFAHLAPGTDPDMIYSLTTFLPTGQTNPRVLLSIDGTVYVTQLDGSKADIIRLPYPCYAPGVSADGSWLACPNETDESHNAPELQIASVSPGSVADVRVPLLAGDGFYLYPTWSPDGTLLAILQDQDNTGSGCGIGLYISSPPYQSFKHLADVTNAIHFLYGGGGCAITGLTWSPDGRWLAVQSWGGLYLVATTALLRIASTASGRAPVSVDLPNTDFVLVAGDSFSPLSSGGQWSWSAFAPAWDPHTNLLTYLSISGTASMQEEIVTYDPVRSNRQVVLRFLLMGATAGGTNGPGMVEHVDTVAWTPDGQQMLLVVNQSVGCVDCAMTYPSDVYLYTPSP